MWLEDLAQHLEETGHGTRGKSIIIGRLDDSKLAESPMIGLMIEPGNVYFTQGVKGAAVRQPMIQLSSRAEDYIDAWNAIEGAWNELGQIENMTIGGTRFLVVKAQGDIEDNDRDEKDRQEFVAHMEVWL
jgi:hypothetical protein